MSTLVFVLAVIGALTLFCAALVLLALLFASALPDEPLQVRERDRELVPLVPAQTRKKHPEIWIN